MTGDVFAIEVSGLYTSAVLSIVLIDGEDMGVWDYIVR